MKMIIHYYLNENKEPQVTEITDPSKVIAILKVVAKVKSKTLTEKEQLLYNNLPAQFQRKTAVQLAVNLGLGKNFFELSMRKIVFSGMFRKTDHGMYKKKPVHNF